MSFSFDVEGYANQFEGQAKIIRLLYIANKGSAEIQAEALRLAIAELKQGLNTTAYVETIGKFQRLQLPGPALTLDEEWLKARRSEIEAKEASLEDELKTAKSNLISQQIRLTFLAMGSFWHSRGNCNEALKNYARSKDFCAHTSDILSCCLNALKISVEMKNGPNISNYILLAEQAPDYKENLTATAKLHAAQGLGHLFGKQYKRAALQFTKVAGGSNFKWSEVTSPQEIAMYGALCSLSQFNRQELKEHVISNVAFREFLDTFPLARELVYNFYDSHYAALLANLEMLEKRLALDWGLDEAAGNLCKLVRQKALVQYSTPFTTISLPSMAAAFSTDVQSLQSDLVKLIQLGDIYARIDSASQVLYKTRTDIQAKSRRGVLAESEEHLRMTKAMLVNIQLQKAGMVQRPAQGGGKSRRQSAPPGPPSRTFARNVEAPPGLLHAEEDEISLEADEDTAQMADDIMIDSDPVDVDNVAIDES